MCIKPVKARGIYKERILSALAHLAHNKLMPGGNAGCAYSNIYRTAMNGISIT